MRAVVYEDEHLRIEELAEQRVIIVRRLRSRADVAVLAATYGEALGRHREQYAGWGLVLDLREALGRSEEGFERAMADLNREARRIYARVVTLVASAAGELQVQRLAREFGWEAIVARDEDEAIELSNPRR